MLETHKDANKKHKKNFITVVNQNSNKELIDEDKKGKSKKQLDKKKSKTIKGLKKLKLENIEVKEEKKTKYSLGDIKIAKIHQQVTRPLKQIKDLTKEEIKLNSCPCCGLPKRYEGKLENYKISDSPDDFSNCGEGVVLYFSFFKFCIIVAFIATIGITLFDSYISYYYYSKLKIFCDKLPKFNDCFMFGKCGPSYICQIYSKKYRMNSTTSYVTYTSLFDSFFFKTSLVIYNNYINMNTFLNGEIKNGKTTINPNIVNALWLITIFILYLLYILFMYNKSNAANFSYCTVGDYSLILTNLEKIYKKFEKNLEYIKDKENEFPDSFMKLDMKLYEEKLGFEPDMNIPKLDLFKKFLEKKLFQNYDVKRIDLCYKVNEIISLEKDIEELEKKIERMEFDLSIIEKNEEKGIKGDKRFYFNCCLCCGESLKKIKKKKKSKEKELNGLKESSKENDSKNFCGIAFITFNTIKEQEDYLYKNKKSSCCSSSLFDAFITLFKVYFYCYCPYCCCCFCCCCFCCCRGECCIRCKYENSPDFYKKIIRFERAPEPEEVIFENLEIKFKTKLKYILYTSFASLIILFISLEINSLLFTYQSIIESNNKTINFYIVSFMITIIGAVIDLILEIVIEKLIKCQKSYTLTIFQATYSIYLTFFWFINSCLIPVAYEIINSTTGNYEIISNNLLTKFLFNSFLTPIMWALNVKFVYKKLKQFIIEKKEKINYNQKELNELYELQSMNIGVKYSYLVETLLMSFFFSFIFPLGFGISFFGLIFAYWLEKYNFCNMYKKPEKLDKQIAEYYITYFFIIFFDFALGNFYFLMGSSVSRLDYFFPDKLILIFLIISNIFLFIPFQQCLKKDCLKLKESNVHKKTYDDMYLFFVNDYERANPMTRIEGEMRYLDKLEGKNKINKKEKDKRLKKIKEENQIKSYLKIKD